MPSATAPSDGRPLLISIGGLPATGKTTLARGLAARLRAAYVRIDTIETAVGRAECRFQQTNGWVLAPGYVVGYDVAADQLRTGLDVVAESVNPLRTSRDAWRDAGIAAGARVVEVEVVCSDVDEHRRRCEERVVDVTGLSQPTWQQISDREYEPWERSRVVIDTAMVGVEEAIEQIRAAVGAQA